MHDGRVTGLQVAAVRRGPMVRREVLEVSRAGVVGDRKRGSKRPVVVVAEEAWRAACVEAGVAVSAAERRGQVVVSGVDLAGGVGRELVLGEAVLRIRGECDPCARLEALGAGFERALSIGWRAGVWCDVLRPGVVRLGDLAQLRAPSQRVLDLQE